MPACLRAAQALADKASGDAKRLYTGGRSPFLDLLDAERTAAQADEALAASNAQVADDQVSLFLTLGGGWETEAG